MKFPSPPFLLIVLLSPFLTGCADLSFLEPAPDQTRFYYLQEKEGAYTGEAGLSILIGPASISRHLDQPGIAVFPDKNVITYSSTNRWAEPLADSISRFLASVLSSELGTAQVGIQRRMSGRDSDFHIGYHIQQFGGQPGGPVELQVSWWIRGWDNEARHFESSRFSTTSPEGKGYDAYVESLRSLISQWGGKIADSINTYTTRHAEVP